MRKTVRGKLFGWAMPLLICGAGAACLLYPSPLGAQAGPETGDAKLWGDLIAAVVGALAGAFVAGYIGWKTAISAARATDRLNEQHARERAEMLCEMLRTEIDCNLEFLKDEKKRLDAAYTGYSPAAWLTLSACPQWATTVWDNSVQDLARILNAQQMTAVHAFYRDLHSLVSVREQLSRLGGANARPMAELEPLVTRSGELMKSLEIANPLARK